MSDPFAIGRPTVVLHQAAPGRVRLGAIARRQADDRTEQAGTDRELQSLARHPCSLPGSLTGQENQLPGFQERPTGSAYLVSLSPTVSVTTSAGRDGNPVGVRRSLPAPEN